MATVKVKFRASSVITKEGTLYFKVIHGRVARQISTGLRLFPHEWDVGKGMTSSQNLMRMGGTRIYAHWTTA